ncbi:MAG: DMT family transporter [Thermus sp.]|uniref:EamA family transporter n=1 Tax=unclassified Thermus TaxID=2619321 RepID=UPI0002389251|nr:MULTISPECIES: DMT family transporter [unclassified Thermus]AEV17099.1 Permease [Thermus sp. CCB_US3_UF1]MCS6868682.1 DMT family transporter [Thermus sp.]MCS7217766.1 DMT family transporter [Thermus sp.]MCX7849555.1 DMT family transporter [Thermus sp.]MDW8016584.1 DMT family transporter [Thermus sp.]
MSYVALAALLWGLGGALAGRFMEAIPPGVLIPLRFLLSFLLLLPLLLRFPPKGEGPRLLGVGLALSGAQAFYYLAIHATSVATGIFLQYLAPALLTLYALLRGERLPGRALGGVALALLGAYVLVVGPGGLSASLLGVAYGLLSALSFALYALFSHGLKTPPLVSLGVATGVGSLLSLPVLLAHLPQVLALSPGAWAAVAYVVTLGTVVPFGLFLLGVRTVPARQATLVAMLEPVAGALFAWPLAGQALRLEALLGGALILLGVALNRR